MKSIQQIREAYNIATNLSEAEDRKLSSLVELGLLDAKKLPALKESLNKPVEQMTGSEKRLFLNLLESVLSEMQVKQSKDIKDYYATPDPRVKRAGYPSQKEAPSVLLLKRKAIRVFPDGQKVALYYAQAIDKYVSIPYNEIGINEQAVEPSERELVEEPSSNTSSSSTGTTRKFSEPMKAGATRLNVGAPGNPQDVRIRTGLDATMERLNRMAQAAMARDVRESFHNKLDVLKEVAAKRKWWEPETTEGGRKSGALGIGSGGGSGIFPSDFGADSYNTEVGKVKRPDQFVSRPANLNISTGIKTKPSSPPTRVVPRRRTSPNETPDRRRRETEPSPRGPGRYTPAQPKPSGPPTRKPVEQPKPAEQPKPQIPKPDKQPQPKTPQPKKVEPDVKPLKPVPVSPERREPEVKPAPKKPTAPAREAPAYKPKPAARPEFPGALPAAKPAGQPAVAPTQQPASQPSPLSQPQNQPWKDAAKWTQTQGQPAANQAQQKKPDEGKDKKKREDRKRGRFIPPGGSLSMPPKTPLQPMTPSLKLAVMAPSGKAYTSLDSADAIRARKAMIAQASMQESVNLDGNLFELNNKTAEKVTALYESLNKKNKKKMIEMMNESAESLEKVISFAVRQ